MSGSSFLQFKWASTDRLGFCEEAEIGGVGPVWQGY